MSNLSDNKLNKLNTMSQQGGFWYITKQNLIFRDLCFIAKLLEDWNDRRDQNYESFFDRNKTLPEYGGLAPLTAHRATKNCEYVGLTRPAPNYSAQSLTPFYYSLKEFCNGDFDNLQSCPHIVDRQLERICINSETNSLYTNHFQICPFMFLFKILLLIGDITDSYKISTLEFKLFVATAQKWNEYFEVVESILRYRHDENYRNQCNANNTKVADVRYNILAQNHSQLEVTKNDVAIKEGEVAIIRRKVAEFELNENVNSTDFMFSADPELQMPLQQIFFGAPGTGKSNTIRKEVDEKKKINFRVTFHPDSDYSTFVGCYKPTMKETVITKDGVESKEEQIVYRFVPQAFTKAYTAAWNTEDEVYLIIEEINRGNCAQIFGDLFQLLDRKNGFSEYPVDTDTDMEDHIKKELTNSSRKDFPEGVKEGKKLVLPQNLHIWATMNTSDQSLFPIDSAFKRRWNWKYMPIYDAGKNWKIEVNGVRYSWGNFLKKINEQIGTTTSSEDKKLGYFFCKANNDGIIDADMFVGKVIFYLWNDVFKDYDLDGVLFVDEDENGKKSKLTFDKFYTSVNGETKVVGEKIEQFLKNLDLEPDEIDEDEDGNPTDPKNPRRKNYDKFSIDGEGRWGKNRLAFECVKEYVNRNPEMTASDVFNVWEKINPGVGPHFIELETVWKNRTDKSKDRSSEIICKDDSKLYVLRNGYGSNGMVEKFMENVNGNQSIGQIIERHK